MGGKQGLISRSFFAKEISVDVSRVFPVMALATMSSGKSTLINALLGLDILPSRNEACTAKVYSILDDDSAKAAKLYLTFRDGSVKVADQDLAKALEDANRSNEVKDILISGEIEGIINTDRNLLIIDTPGPNNARDESHKAITEKNLEKLKGGLILYVINATQMGIYDDSKLLLAVKERMKKQDRIKLLFVVNKMDAIDSEKESISDLMTEIKDYIEGNGIIGPDIIPVSALAASLFKKALAGESFTRSQYRNFLSYYDRYRTSDLCLASYALMRGEPNRMDRIAVRGEEYTVAELLAAIENTGIACLEKYIQKAQILSSEKSAASIKVRKREGFNDPGRENRQSLAKKKLQ